MVSPRVLLMLLGAGCGAPPEAPVEAPPAERVADTAADIPSLEPVPLLFRASLDLRGVLPSEDEIRSVEDDPASIDAVIDGFLEDPRFEERMVDFWAEVTLTQADQFFFQAADFGRTDEAGFARSVGHEPARLMARVTADGAPWTDVVTADWTVANALLVDVWPLEQRGAPRGPEGWFEAVYTDGRPAAGILATNGMWWRYQSTDSNANRKRANQVSRILLCNDYLLRPIDFDRDLDLLDTDAVNDAIQTDPGCVNCHVSLDPIASYLFGFWAFNNQSWLDSTTYHPDREQLWQSYTEVPPSWYGAPGSSLEDLGHQIAGDPRFPQCAVERVYAGLLRRETGLLDTDTLTDHREAFLDGGLSMKALFASVVRDPRYRAADTTHPAVEAAGAVPTKLLTATQLASLVEDLTGFSWTYADYEMLETDLVGVRTLAGGADGRTVTRSARTPNATLLLVQERLAEAGASALLVAEVALDPADRRVFREVDFTETPDGPGRSAMVAQLQHLHLLLFGERVAADGEEVDANLALWEALHAATGNPGLAWLGVTTALLRDPDLLLY